MFHVSTGRKVLSLLFAIFLVLPFGVASAQGAFNAEDVDWNAADIDFDHYVGPLLVERGVFPELVDEGYIAWEDLFGSPAGELIIPFDAERSNFVRFVERLPETESIPYPGLRNLRSEELAYVKRWIEDGARGPEGKVPYSDSQNLLFACIQGENAVAVIDADRRQVIRWVSMDDHGLESTPHGPHHIVFESDGSAMYVSMVSGGIIAKLSMDLSMDPSSPEFLLGHTPVGEFATPGMMAIDANSNRLYVGRSTLSTETTADFGVIDRETMTIEKIATPFNVPHALSITPDGRYVLTAALTGNRVAVYDAETEDLAITPLEGPARELIHFSVLAPHGEAAPQAPRSYTATLTDRANDEVLFFSLTPEGKIALEGTVPAGDGPYHGHLALDGTTVMVPNQFGNTVTLIDAPSRSVAVTVQNPEEDNPISGPHTPAPGPGGETFFVTSTNLDGAWTPSWLFTTEDGTKMEPEDAGNVAVFSMDGELQKVIQLGAYPAGLEHFHGKQGEMDHEMNNDQ